MAIIVLRVLGGIALCGLAACMLKWPRKVWYITQGWWAYDNPDEVRLSDGYILLCVWNAAMAFLIGLGVIVVALFEALRM